VRNTRWAHPERHPTIGSTNAEALLDPRPGRVVVADHQSAGVGRRGRTWTAPPGSALAVTVVVPAPAPPDLGWVPLLAGLAVAQALRQGRYAVPARLKWPNDVLVAEQGEWRKICGVLAQGAEHAERGAVVVVGAGINIDQARPDLPVPGATSWRLARGAGPLPRRVRESLLQGYLAAFAALLADPAASRTAYLAACDTLGRTVQVHLPDGSLRQGRAVQVDRWGALVVEGAGRRTVHRAGDVVHLRAGEVG
jgi:BirA family biotin operon repressor/biotin-[acetyl-CoA-carboxylase] ligase